MAVKIRDATARDEDAVLRLNAESVEFLSPLDAPALQRLAAQAVCYRVTENEGEVAAFLLALAPGADYASENYRWFSSHYAHFLYVDRIVVGKKHQGQGYGNALCEDIFAFARARGYPRIVAEFDVDPPNPISAAFHARFGFHEVGTQWVRGGAKRVSLQEAPLE